MVEGNGFQTPTLETETPVLIYRGPALRLWGNGSTACLLQQLCLPPAGDTMTLTLTLRWWMREGWHLTLLVLQQPVQRFTSTHGGQIRKLADVGSTWLRGIS